MVEFDFKRIQFVKNLTDHLYKRNERSNYSVALREKFNPRVSFVLLCFLVAVPLQEHAAMQIGSIPIQLVHLVNKTLNTF